MKSLITIMYEHKNNYEGYNEWLDQFKDGPTEEDLQAMSNEELKLLATYPIK